MESCLGSVGPLLDVTFRQHNRDGFFVVIPKERLEKHLELITDEYRVSPEVYRWGQLVAWLYTCEQLKIALGVPPLDERVLDGFSDPAGCIDRWMKTYRENNRIDGVPFADPGSSEFYLPGATHVCKSMLSAFRVYEGWEAARLVFAAKVLPPVEGVIGKGLDGTFLKEVDTFTQTITSLAEEFRERFIEEFRSSRFRADLVYPERSPIDGETLALGFDLTRAKLFKTYFAAMTAVFQPLLGEIGKMRERDRSAEKVGGQTRINGFVSDCTNFHLGYLTSLSRQTFDRETIADRIRKPKKDDANLMEDLERLGGFEKNANKIFQINKQLRKDGSTRTS